MPTVDHAVAELLRAVGYAVASHVMARASLSRGTGRHEEPLTADVADLLHLFDPYRHFLSAKSSRSAVALRVIDFHKQQESKAGADFVIIVRGSAGRPRATIRKLILVQAKREMWGQGRYATSSNQVSKATTMAGIVGLNNSFFAYYHSNAIIPAMQSMPVMKLWSGAPEFLYSSPVRYGNRHFFEKGRLHMSLPEGFLEQSAYRRHILGSRRAYSLPIGYEWGIGMLGAGYFIDGNGTTVNTSLPSIAHVLTNGRCIGDFLVALAECSEGTQCSDGDIVSLIRTLQAGAIGDGEGSFEAMFALAFDFTSCGPDDDDCFPHVDDEFWNRVEGVRELDMEYGE